MKVSKTYNKTYKTYSLSIKGLSKPQLNMLHHLLRYLTIDGVVYQYSKGFTMPYLAVESLIPLQPSNGLFLIPNSSIREVCEIFGNNDLPNTDIFCDLHGKPISKLKYHG